MLLEKERTIEDDLIENWQIEEIQNDIFLDDEEAEVLEEEVEDGE
jgi:hypothetical protein|tara:strand:- start:681 stop:815 length:135 start_codon:yes stop_codon:yes gene_type:complete